MIEQITSVLGAGFARRHRAFKLWTASRGMQQHWTLWKQT